MSLFKERIPYKPFEYPEYYTEGWLPQAQAFWLHTEIPMSGDVKDWKEKLTPEEKHLVGNILLGFAQTECAVSDYWTQKVVSWFPKHEIQQMAMMFGSQETIHAVAYSYLNETLGLENFEAFLHEPATAERFENLVAYEGKDPIGIGKSLAIFSAFHSTLRTSLNRRCLTLLDQVSYPLPCILELLLLEFHTSVLTKFRS